MNDINTYHRRFKTIDSYTATSPVNICRYYDASIVSPEVGTTDYMPMVHIQSPLGGWVRLPTWAMLTVTNCSYGSYESLYDKYSTRQLVLWSDCDYNLSDVYTHTEFADLCVVCNTVLSTCLKLNNVTSSHLRTYTPTSSRDVVMCIHPDYVNTTAIDTTLPDVTVATINLSYYSMSLLVSLAYHLNDGSVNLPKI